MLPIESLQVFVVAAEMENFSKAARLLHMSQPAVSQHIQLLEKQLGVNLFERNGRRVRLSAEGVSLLPLAKDVLRASKRMEEVAWALSGQVVGHLTIGCSTTSGKYILPRLLAMYRQRHPLVRATVKVGLREQVIEWLLSGDVDVAITSERVPRSGLNYRRFFHDEIVLIVPRTHPWANKKYIQPNELYYEVYVMRESTSGTYMALKEGLDQVGINADELERVITLANSEAIIMAVEEGIGLGFVPRVAVERCLNLGKVAIVPIKGLEMKRWIYMAHNTSCPETPAQKAFCAFLDNVEEVLRGIVGAIYQT